MLQACFVNTRRTSRERCNPASLERARDAHEILDGELLAAGGGRDTGALEDVGCRGGPPALRFLSWSKDGGKCLPEHLATLLERGIHDLECPQALRLRTSLLLVALERHEHAVDVGDGPEHLARHRAGEPPWAVPGGLDA